MVVSRAIDSSRGRNRRNPWIGRKLLRRNGPRKEALDARSLLLLLLARARAAGRFTDHGWQPCSPPRVILHSVGGTWPPLSANLSSGCAAPAPGPIPGLAAADCSLRSRAIFTQLNSARMRHSIKESGKSNRSASSLSNTFRQRRQITLRSPLRRHRLTQYRSIFLT